LVHRPIFLTRRRRKYRNAAQAGRIAVTSAISQLGNPIRSLSNLTITPGDHAVGTSSRSWAKMNPEDGEVPLRSGRDFHPMPDEILARHASHAALCTASSLGIVTPAREIKIVP